MLFLVLFNRKNTELDSKKKTLSSNDWPDFVVSLNTKNFNEFIQKYSLSVVDFWAPWCVPCRTMMPRFRRLSMIYKGKVAFGRLNIQQNDDIYKKYKIIMTGDGKFSRNRVGYYKCY